MRKWMLAAAVSAGVLTGGCGAEAAVSPPPVRYVAFGDSVAAGQTPFSKLDAGYTDMIAAEYKRHGRLAFFTKQPAVSGFTTDQVLASVRAKEGKALLKKANLVTISAGANDLLQMIRFNPSLMAISFNQQEADRRLNRARLNLEATLREVKKAAPKARVFVIGYYFSFPALRPEQSQGPRRQFDRLEKLLRQTAKRGQAQFISVKKGFDQNATAYLPNPFDVHPSPEGYRYIANQFFKAAELTGDYAVSKDEVPKPAPKPLAPVGAGGRLPR